MFLAAAQELGRRARGLDGDGGRRRRSAGRQGRPTWRAIGIARVDDAELLAAAHADIVVKSLDDVDMAALADGRLAIAAAR